MSEKRIGPRQRELLLAALESGKLSLDVSGGWQPQARSLDRRGLVYDPHPVRGKPAFHMGWARLTHEGRCFARKLKVAASETSGASAIPDDPSGESGLTFISDHHRPSRCYRVTDPGDAIHLARVEYLRGDEWRACPNLTTRSIAHVLVHGRSLEPGYHRYVELAAAARVVEPTSPARTPGASRV